MTPAGLDRRQAIALAAGGVALVAFAISALTQLGGPNPTPSRPPKLPPSPLVGVVVLVDEESISQINSFDLLTPDGKRYTLALGPLDNATQFSPSHLSVHLATGVPIRAFYRLENGWPVVYHLEDAVPASAAPGAT